MKDLKSLILERYDVKETDSKIISLAIKGTDKYKAVLPSKGDIFISLQDIPEEEKKPENIERLVKEGKGIKISRWDLYKMLSSLSEEELFIKFYGYTPRTHKYLQAVKKNIGLLDHKVDYNEEKFEVLRQYDLFFNLTGSGKIDIGKIGENRYVAQFSYRSDIDDYQIEKLYFNHMPSENNVKTALLLSEIELYFMLHPRQDVFTCWECGREVHWLDVEAKDLNERFDMLKERYCGC